MISTSAEHQIFRSAADLFVQLKGRIVLEDCERLRGALVPAIGAGVERVYVDLAQVDYVDSAGLGLLVGLKMTAKKNGSRIILLQPSRQVGDILYISKLDGIFEVLTGAEAQSVRTSLAVPENSSSPNTAAGNARSGSPQAPQKPGAPAEWLQSRLDTAYPDKQTGPEGSGGAATDQVEEHCRRAVDYMRQGNYEMSVEEYRSALALAPDYLPALNNLAIVYEKQPSWNALAIEQWEKVLELSRSNGDQKHQDRAQRHLTNLRKMQG